MREITSVQQPRDFLQCRAELFSLRQKYFEFAAGENIDPAAGQYHGTDIVAFVAGDGGVEGRGRSPG